MPNSSTNGMDGGDGVLRETAKSLDDERDKFHSYRATGREVGNQLAADPNLEGMARS